MRLHRTDAIILHTVPVRERDKMVIFLTPDHGKRKGWAYGARAIRSRFGAALEPLAKVTIGYSERESEEVVRIETVDLIRSLFPAQQNLVSSVAATYITELVDTNTPPNDPAEVTYRLLDRTTEALLDGVPPLPVIAYAEIWTLKLAGTFPSLRNCVECGTPLDWPLRFDSRVSGFVCPGDSGRDTTTVPNEVAEALEAIHRQPVAEFASRRWTLEILIEVRSLAASIRRNFLGHELKSFEVLASVLGSE